MHDATGKIRKAIAITSGGLDSALAIRIVKGLGIDILAVHYSEPTCWRTDTDGANKFVEASCSKMGVPFRFITIGQEFLDMLTHPKHGYGSGFNPCTDCHTLMLKKAGETMVAEGASFLITGEVVGQRPMSQTMERLRTVERESGLSGLILRPLSAKLLDPTVPEKEGWVDREKLLAIRGRSRREQMRLAKEYGITDYSTPAGGCLLTDERFARIIRDHIDRRPLLMEDVSLLKTGRHFRFYDGSRLVLGRDKTENEALRRTERESDVFLFPVSTKGPTAILRYWSGNDATLTLGMETVACYCDGEGAVTVKIEQAGTSREATATRRNRADMEMWHI